MLIMNKKTYYSILLLVLILLVFRNVYANEINIMVDEIDETRSTNETFRKLNVTLKIKGAILNNSKGILPIKISKAYCDKGSNLKPLLDISKANLFAFSKLESDLTSKQTIHLSAPERFNKILFIEGEITLYKPKPSSRVKIENFHLHTKQKIKKSVLSSNNIEVLFFTKYEYKNFILAAQDIERKAIANNKNIHDALSKHFGSEITYIIENSNYMLLGNYDIYFIISGNWKKVVNIEMIDQSGKTLENHSRSLIHGPNKIIYGLDYNGYLPSSGNVAIDIIQEGDTIAVPFKIETELP